MPSENSIELDRELESMSRLWRAFLARMFLDVLDPRARIRREASDFWADDEHFRFICELAGIEDEPLSDCYDHLWTLAPDKQAPYAALVRDALTKGLLLPTPSKMARAAGASDAPAWLTPGRK